MPDLISTIQESGNQLFDANNELFAIVELLQTEDRQELKMSEWGRIGLAQILNRICTAISEANCNLPMANDLNSEIETLAMERAASIAVTRMGKACGDMEAGNE